jgi:hypothetical protein
MRATGHPRAMTTEVVRSKVLDRRAVRDLDGRSAADALARARDALVASEVAQVELVAHWVDLHCGEAGPSRDVLPGTERSVGLGADGTPRVREFAAVELGVLLDVTTTAAQGLMRDVLDLRHRHPLLWAAVLSGRARFWQARQVSRAAHHAGLDRAAARHVDARTAPHLGLVPWGRMITLVEAAVIEADPESAEQRRLAAEMARFVRTGQSSEHGITTIYARARAGDAIFFLAMCDRIAQILRLRGACEVAGPAGLAAADREQLGMDALRSEAVGILATPARAMALLAWGERQYRGSEGRRGAGATSMVNAGADPEAFAPPATLYVHLSGDQLLRRTRGAARVKGVGAVTVEQAVDLLRHTRVTVRPVLDLSQTWAVDGYETPPRMREQVTLRWPVEVFPNGTLPARRGDLDHVVPYRPTGPPGQTSAENLAPLSRRHHRVKTHGHGWVHRQPVPGVHYWRTPHGHWARVDHRGTHRLGRALTAADQLLLAEAASAVERRFAELLIAA